MLFTPFQDLVLLTLGCVVYVEISLKWGALGTDSGLSGNERLFVNGIKEPISACLWRLVSRSAILRV